MENKKSYTTDGKVKHLSSEEDINVKLGKIIGEKFVNYRKTWDAANKFQIVTDFPLFLHVDMNQVCNYRCPHCIIAYKDEVDEYYEGKYLNFKKSEPKKLKGISESNYISFNKADKIRNTLFLDVREKKEIPKIYLKNGVNIPLNELSIKNKLLKKSKNIVIFCQSGKRSKIALNLLKENEFLNLKLMTENAIEISRIINKK